MNTLTILREKKVDITPGMFGLFFEDINYAADGGLYGEMIENRNFEFLRTRGHKDVWVNEEARDYGWSLRCVQGAGSVAIETKEPLSHVNTHYMVVEVGENPQTDPVNTSCVKLYNKAYDGVYLKKGMEYHISFWIRSITFMGSISVGAGDDKLLAVTVESKPPKKGDSQMTSASWQKVELTLLASSDIKKGKFYLEFEGAGMVALDMISMFPSDAVAGIFRKDLFDRLKELKPGFMRFPGGCIVEGNTLYNRYQWKESVGHIEDRRVNWSRWAVHDTHKFPNETTPFSYYNQTLGLGYYEYFLLCELLGAKPLPVANVGLACQYQSTEMVASDSKEFKEFIQDTLDLIEFANGEENTTWGKVRASMGHKEPFHMTLLGIGNEQWETENVDFFHRYEEFETAIHAKYPDMQLISSAGPNVETPTYDAAWSWLRKEHPDQFAYAVDEHYYVSPKWCYEHVHMYDKYPRDIKVFAGEYAAHVENQDNMLLRNNMEAALAEAALLTGIEKNADVVVLASYAPLFARIGYTQWSPDMIWFDGEKSYATPSYLIQQLYFLHTGDYTLETVEAYEEELYTSVSFRKHGESILIKVVNPEATKKTLVLQDEVLTNKLKGKDPLTITRYMVKADTLEAVNSMEATDTVKMDVAQLFVTENLEISIPPYSALVLEYGVNC